MTRCLGVSTDTYCCDYALNSCDCAAGIGVISFSGQPSTITTIQLPPPASFTTNSSSTVAVTPSSATTTTQNTAFSTSVAASRSSSAANQSGTATAGPSSGSNHTATVVGAAVGVPVGFVAFAALGYFLYRYRRNQRQQRALLPREKAEDVAFRRILLLLVKVLPLMSFVLPLMNMLPLMSFLLPLVKMLPLMSFELLMCMNSLEIDSKVETRRYDLRG